MYNTFKIYDLVILLAFIDFTNIVFSNSYDESTDKGITAQVQRTPFQLCRRKSEIK